MKYCDANGLENFFTYQELHQTFYHHFLEAVLQRGVKEDFILTKLGDTGWNIVQLKNDPTKEVQKILNKALKHILSEADWYLLNYFQTIAILNCEHIINSSDISREPTSIIEIYNTLVN